MLQHRGPCQKINRPLEKNHEGLGITDKEFDVVVNHLAVTLKEIKVPEREHDEVMTKIANLRSYIVERKS